MGMLACYIEADKQLIDTLKKKDEEELFDIIEELQEEEEVEVCDIDKMWDGLHYLLTGVSAATPIENNPLSEAILGVDMFSDDEDADFISYIYPDRLKIIVDKLNDINIADMRSKFSATIFTKKGIHPSIWMDEPEDALFEELL